ncbi:MAG: type VII toxin-antitoxin system HepT family RNase toxin [Candidatus Heimdallarchaeaceae archaeon]
MRIDIYISKFDRIKENVRLIKENLTDNLEDFRKLGLVKDGIYKRYEYSVELIIDVVAMINADLKLGIPNGTIDVLEQLERHEILNSEMVEKIKGMRGFRNVLVHRYGILDEEIAYDIIKSKLSDFEILENELMSIIRRKMNE